MEPEHDRLIHRDECFAIQGAVFEVYREMGCGFLEAVYQECLARELRKRGIPHETQTALSLSYKGERLDQVYRPDFVCHGKIIVEIKAVAAITNEHRAQVFNYLKATGFRVGLLVNFGHFPKATVARIVR